jgi:hypothetical protein
LSNPDDALALYHLAYSEYELIRYRMIDKQSGLYDAYVDAAVAHAKQVLTMRPEWSEGLALLANIYGIQISQSWVKAATLGAEANALTQRAIKSDSTNHLLSSGWKKRILLEGVFLEDLLRDAVGE